ncbi:MAG TPA: hypothetical protein VMV10_19575 [Pirellulales bacterium]|nr:hypothetical protein [Pirellulales bacterium]
MNATRTVYFDGAKIRGDTSKPYGVRPPAAHADKHTDVSCFGCYSNDMHFSCTDRMSEDGAPLAASITDRNHVNEDADYVPDPRWIGFIPIDSFGMRNYHMDYVVGGKGSEAAQVTRENLNGHECQRLEFKRPWGSTARVWIAPAASYSVMRNEVEFDNGGVHYVDRVDVEVEKHLASGIWFPTKAYFERRETRAGATQVTMEEKLAIDVRQLNEAVAPSVFSLGGVEILKPGTKIMWVSDRPAPVAGAQLLEWNGEKLVAARGLAPRRPPQGRVNRLPLLYFNCAVVAALVAAVALHRHYRGRGAEAPKSM